MTTNAQKIRRLSPEIGGKLKPLIEEYRGSIVGGMATLADKLLPSLYLAESGRWPEHRPIEVFRIDGPTGVGKSLGVKRLFKILGGKPEALLYIDGAAMQSPHEAARLFGAPPGYVGYGEDPIINRKTLAASQTSHFQNPFILWDEYDKTHPSVKRSFLNSFEEGMVTLGSGAKVSLRGAFIFMTSNLAATEISKRTMRFEGGTVGKGELSKAMREEEAPELRNRFTQTMWVEPLTKEDCQNIIDLEMLAALKNFKIKCNVRLEQSMRTAVLESGYSPDFGAREIKRVILREIIPALASLENEAKVIRIGHNGSGFEFSAME